MQRRYTCVCCGWIGCEKTDPIRCPDCGGITQRVITNWDGVQSDLLKLGGVLLSFVSMAYVWTLLTYPFTFGYQPSHKVELQISAAGLIDTPNGPVARLQIANGSIHQFAELQVGMRIYVYQHGRSEPIALALPEKVIRVVNLDPHASQLFFDVALAGREKGDLFGWNAQMVSHELPSGYWNRRLQAALSVRIANLHPHVPVPFAKPHRPLK
jgi:hypothetical protein